MLPFGSKVWWEPNHFINCMTLYYGFCGPLIIYEQRVCLNEPFREDALHEEFIDVAIWCVSTYSTQPCLGCVVTANLEKEWSPNLFLVV